jgi:hypothetical protein
MPPDRPVRHVIRPLQGHPWVRITRPGNLFPVTHTMVLATDIVAFGQRYRDISAQLDVRQLMYELLTSAFGITGLSWWDCYREDRGDGALVVVPPYVEPERFLDPLVHHLTALLRHHAWRAGNRPPLRLRMAVHYGCVYYDAHGVTGHTLTHLFRLLEAPTFKKSVAMSQAPFGAIISDKLYTDVVQLGGLINPAAYSQVRLSCKETRTRGWLWLPTKQR